MLNCFVSLLVSLEKWTSLFLPHTTVRGVWYITVNFHVSIFIFKINTIRNDPSAIWPSATNDIIVLLFHLIGKNESNTCHQGRTRVYLPAGGLRVGNIHYTIVHVKSNSCFQINLWNNIEVFVLLRILYFIRKKYQIF